jgi:hypothetical protein
MEPIEKLRIKIPRRSSDEFGIENYNELGNDKIPTLKISKVKEEQNFIYPIQIKEELYCTCFSLFSILFRRVK